MSEHDEQPLSPAAEALWSAWLGNRPGAAPVEITTDLLVRYLSAGLTPEAAAEVETACTAEPALRRRLLETGRELQALRAASWEEVTRTAAPASEVRTAWSSILRERLTALGRAQSAWSRGWERLREQAAAGTAEAWAGLEALRSALTSAAGAPVSTAWARSGATSDSVQAELMADGALVVRTATETPDGTELGLFLRAGGEEFPLGVTQAADGKAEWRLGGFAELFGDASEGLGPGAFVVREGAERSASTARTLWAEPGRGTANLGPVPLEVVGPVRWESGSCRVTVNAEPQVRRRVEGWLLILELRLAPGVEQLLGTHPLSPWTDDGCEIRIPCPDAPDQLLPLLSLLHLTVRPPSHP